MKGYDLTRNWYNYKFEHPDKVRAIHSDMYFYIIDLWNRLGQKEKFGLPTSVTMENLGISSYNTYKKTLDGIVKFGFIKIIQESKNQYQAKVIALSKIDKASSKALDKAHNKATDEAPYKALDSIDKQLTTNITLPATPKFSFFKELINLGVEKDIANDWIKVRKTKKLTNTKTAFEDLKREIEKAGVSANVVIKKCVTQSWGGFKASWATINNSQNINNQNEQQSSVKKADPAAIAAKYQRGNF